MGVTRKLRWGILGVAKINERIIPAFTEARYAELIAIASRTSEKAQRAASRWHIPRAYGSYEALLADREIEAVYIPLPNSLHAPWTIRAAQAGKHVLCEKPLASHAEEARSMVAVCRQCGVALMDGFFWPHHPRTARIREEIARGLIGEVRHVQGSFSFPLELDPSNIRLQPELAGGCVMDVGCYPVYGALWVFGELPHRVFARAQYEFGVDLTMTGILEFGEGKTATFDCSFVWPFRQALEIVGTRGRIRIPDMWLPPDPAVFFVETEDGYKAEIAVSGVNQIAAMLDNFSQAVLHQRPPEPSAENAVQVMQVLDALRESARIGQPITVR
ncbi:MAG: Gfo/Idh/MocA family oxidoreductase [Gemmatales bacterium]|nr:Gfo/Idh/MocA family oxidoreductase [Gemmatales bacterium]